MARPRITGHSHQLTKNLTCSLVAFNDIKHLARLIPAHGLEAQDVVPRHFRRGDRFLGKIHTLARALSRCSACNHLEIAAGDGHGWLWSVVAEAVVRACLTSIGIVRVLLRRLGLPRALCERGYRPSGRGHRCQRPAHHSGRHRGCRNPSRSRLGQSERNARAQRAELAAPPLLSFLHLARNSAYASFGYRQSGRWPFPGGDAAWWPVSCRGFQAWNA